jgi:hypothetical protein
VRYDIFFVRRDPGQKFADALDAKADSDDGDPGPLSAAEREQWDRIVARARGVLGEFEQFTTDTSCELVESASGIQLILIAGEASITVASVDPAADAVALMEKIYALARVVEDETALDGYDPQLQEPISSHDDVTGRVPIVPPLPEDGETDTRAVRSTSQQPAADADDAPVPALRPGRRWWEFWKP